MKIQRISQTQEVGQAANLIIDAIFDGKAVKAVGSKIVIDDKNKMSKMSKTDKDHLVATFLYLIEKKRFETNPEFDPSSKLGHEDIPDFVKWIKTRAPAMFTRPSSGSPDELIALHDSARGKETHTLFKALRAALDVNPLDVDLKTMDGRDTRKTDAIVNNAINLLTGKFPAIFELTQTKYESNLKRLEHFAKNPCYNQSDVEELTYIWQHLAAHEEAIASGRLKTNGWPDSLYADQAAARTKAQELIAEVHVMVLGRTNEYEQRVLANAPNTGPNEATETDDNPAWHQAVPSAPDRTPTPSVTDVEELSVMTEELEPQSEPEPTQTPDPRRIPMPAQNFVPKAHPPKPAPYGWRPVEIEVLETPVVTEELAGAVEQQAEAEFLPGDNFVRRATPQPAPRALPPVAMETQELTVNVRPESASVQSLRVLSQTDIGRGILSFPSSVQGNAELQTLSEDSLDDIDTGAFGHNEAPLEAGDFVVEEDDMNMPVQDDEIDLPSEQLVEEDGIEEPTTPLKLHKVIESSASDIIKGLAKRFPAAPVLTQDEYDSSIKRLEFFEAYPFQSPGDIDNSTHIWQRLITSADNIASGKLKTVDWSDELYAGPDAAKKATLAMLNRFSEMIFTRTEEFETRAAAKLAEGDN